MLPAAIELTFFETQSSQRARREGDREEREGLGRQQLERDRPLLNCFILANFECGQSL
jgi:hypothetical protein